MSRNSPRRYWLTRLLILALTIVIAGCASKGIVHTPATLANIAHPQVKPERVWSHYIGNGSGGFYPAFRIAVAKDGIYVGSENGRAAAYGPASGRLLWSKNTRLRLIAGPSVSGDIVLFGTLNAKVIALQRNSGNMLWKVPAPGAVMAPPVSDGHVVVVRGVNGLIYGLNARNGARIWSFDRSEPSLTVRGQSKPLIVGNRVVIGLDNGDIVALNSATGKLLWSKTLSTSNGGSQLQRLVDIDADPLLSDSGVFAVSYGGNLALFDPISGQVRWQQRVKSDNGMALNANQSTVYVSDTDGYVWALSTANGAREWVNKTLKYRQLSAPVFYHGYVVVGDLDGYLHWLRPSDGKIVGRVRLDSAPIITAPEVGDGLLYVMNTDGYLAAFKDRAPR